MQGRARRTRIGLFWGVLAGLSILAGCRTGETVLVPLAPEAYGLVDGFLESIAVTRANVVEIAVAELDPERRYELEAVVRFLDRVAERTGELRAAAAIWVDASTGELYLQPILEAAIGELPPRWQVAVLIGSAFFDVFDTIEPAGVGRTRDGADGVGRRFVVGADG